MMIYKIVLFLMIFGAISGVINESGFYSVKVPTTGYKGMTEAQVTDLSNSAANTPVNAFSGFAVIVSLVKIIGSSFLAVATVIPFLVGFGMEANFAVAIQGIIWFVTAIGLYQMYTGHQLSGME